MLNGCSPRIAENLFAELIGISTIKLELYNMKELLAPASTK